MLSGNTSSSEVSNSNPLTREQKKVFFDNQVISCRDVEKLYMSFRDKELPIDLYNKIELHIKQCDDCQMMVDTYELVVSVAATLNAPEVTPKEGFQERLKEALNQKLGLQMK